jgi:nitroreductase
MDIYRAIKTMRAVRQYSEQSIGDEIVTRIIEAGRWAVSSKNTQPWQSSNSKGSVFRSSW